MQRCKTEEELDHALLAVLAQLPLTMRLAGLTLEQRLAGLTLEQRLAGLSPDELERLSKLLLSQDDKGAPAPPT